MSNLKKMVLAKKIDLENAFETDKYHLGTGLPMIFTVLPPYVKQTNNYYKVKTRLPRWND